MKTHVLTDIPIHWRQNMALKLAKEAWNQQDLLAGSNFLYLLIARDAADSQ